MSRRASSRRSGSASDAPISSLREEQRVRHAAAEEQGIDPVEQMTDDAELVRDLGAAEDGDEGPLRVVQAAATAP